MKLLTNEILQEKLSKKEFRELNSIIRRHGMPISMCYMDVDKIFSELQTTLDLLNEANVEHQYKVRSLEKIRALELYHKVTLDSRDILVHWNYNFEEQRQISQEHRFVKKSPRKDNGSSKNYGSGNSNRNKIRFPKKCRKTAWKRFYKLFPELAPDNK